MRAWIGSPTSGRAWRILGPACLLLLCGCAWVDPAPSALVFRPAPVNDVEILILESFPVQVHAVVRGALPDACTRIGIVIVTRSGNRFVVEIVAERERDAICAQVLTPYEETVALSVLGLPAGTYIVDVHEVTATFHLDIDNAPAGEASSSGGGV